jgi:hypothetical protein
MVEYEMEDSAAAQRCDPWTSGRNASHFHFTSSPIFRNLRSSISHAQNVDSFLVNVFDTIIGPEQPRKIRIYANGKHLGTV